MRLHVVVLLVIAFLSSVETTTSKLIEPTAQIDTPTARLLRVSETRYTEERAASASVLSKLKQAASDFKTNTKVQSMLRKQTSVDDAFMKLRLNEAGTNLFKNPKLKGWLTYKQLYNQKHGIEDSSGIATILKFFKNDDQLTGMIDRALKDPATRDVAKQFRAGQISQWLRDGKSTKYVFDMLRVRGTAAKSPARVWYNMYRGEYSRIFIQKRPRAPKAVEADLLKVVS
jgi:hypothetical protein